MKGALRIFLFLPTLAYAHAGTGEGFLRGLQHPLGGIDHVLVMLAVGVFLGLQVAGAARLLVGTAAIVGLAAVLHEHGHGWAYSSGLLAGTSLLLGLGIVLALLARRIKRRMAW